MSPLRYALLCAFATSSGACAPAEKPPEEEVSDAPAGCAIDELETEDGGCLAPGIAPQLCAAGFETDGARGCLAILPAEPCPAGLMAVPGETNCRPVAPCGDGRWGDVARDSTTSHVDASYQGGDSDGSEGRPWSQIQNAISNAAPGAIVAIAAGSYQGPLVLEGKALQILGRCPELVELATSESDAVALTIGAGGDGSLIRGLAITGGGAGVRADGALDVALEELWIHDTGSAALMVGSKGPTHVLLRDSLIERARGGAVAVSGVSLTIKRSVIRTSPALAGPGVGIMALRSAATRQPAQLLIDASVVEANEGIGISSNCASTRIHHSVIRGNGMSAESSGVFASDCAEAIPSSLEIADSVIERNLNAGVLTSGAEVRLTRTVLRNTARQEASSHAIGAVFMGGGHTGWPGDATLTQVVVSGSTRSGLQVSHARLHAEQLLVLDTQPDPATGFGEGLLVRAGEQGEATTVSIRGGRFDPSDVTGIVLLGAEGHFEHLRIDSPKRSSAFPGRLGEGILMSYLPEHQLPGKLVLRDSLISDAAKFGVLVLSSFADLERVRFEGATGGSDELYGDGLVVVTGSGVPEAARASATVRECTFANNARAGLSNFGANVLIANNTWQCNAVQLNGESDYEGMHATFSFDDRGGNRCSCGGDADAACEIVSNQLPLGPLSPLELSQANPFFR